jgi:hypothetical protein
MPSTSRTQQRLMGTAYAVKSGQTKLSDVDPNYRDKVKDLVDGMTLKQLKDFAETKHEGLPERVPEEEQIQEYSLGSYYTGSFFWFTQAGQAGVQKVAMSGDRSDSKIQSFMDYMEENMNEGDYGAALAASPSNVPGMGNAAPATDSQTGSGDVFDEPGKVGIMSYEDYKKWLEKWRKRKQQQQQ